jgi:hypothetical protein
MVKVATEVRPIAATTQIDTIHATPTTKAKATPADSANLAKRMVSRESADQFLALLNAAPARHLYSTLGPLTTDHNTESLTRIDQTATRTEEMTGLLQRYCSDLYVESTSSERGSRMLVMLDAALPGAAAELVREGAFLRVRLHAWNDAAFRVMSAQRHSLNVALGDATPLNVVVEVVREERHDGNAR